MKQKKSFRINRIYLGPFEVTGYYANLARGFQEIGIKAECGFLHDHAFNYSESFSWDSRILKLNRWIIKYQQKEFFFLIDIVFKIISFALRVLLLIRALHRYDAFILASGQGFLGMSSDLGILKAFSKKVVVVHHGSDFRPAIINGFYLKRFNNVVESLTLAKFESIKQAKIIKKIEKYADYIVGSPLSSSQLFERKQIMHQLIGLPAPKLEIKQKGSFQKKTKSRDCVNILHAPSNRLGKGSYEITRVIQELKDEGYEIDYIEIVGKSNARVIRALKECDFIIDQLYSDTYLAGFATEAAALGKPSVVGGLGWEILNSFVHSGYRPPFFQINPDELKGTLEFLIKNPEAVTKMGLKVKDYIKNNLQAAKVAKRYRTILEDQIDDNWFFDPKNISYMWGCGLAKEEAMNFFKIYSQLSEDEQKILMNNSKVRRKILSTIKR